MNLEINNLRNLREVFYKLKIIKISILLILILFVIQNLHSQTRYVFRNLGIIINTTLDEFQPIICNDTLYFKRSNTDIKNNKYDIFWLPCNSLNLDSSRITEIIRIYNTRKYGNSSQPIDPDASTNPKVSMDPSTPSFYRFTSDKLSVYIMGEPTRMEYDVSTNYNDLHPALSPDGKIIVFASDRTKNPESKEPEKDTDLYITYRTKDNTWTKPKNLGKKINTSENEITPFIDKNGNLFYSSKGFLRDSFNVVFSGQERQKPLTKSDIFISKEVINYNIIKAKPGSSQGEPFINPEILPAPINTEFNETGPTLWKDSLLYLASDRLKPYDRPDPNNQIGYDLYGFLADEDLVFDSIPFFVTGYYYPTTAENLDELIDKIDAGVLRTNNTNSYVADPNFENDENGVLINYQTFAPKVEVFLNKVAAKILSRLKRSNDIINVKIIGYSDPRNMNEEALYVENSIDDPSRNFSIQSGQSIDNLLLSKLRTYITSIQIENLLLKESEYINKRERVVWEIEGMGVDPNSTSNLKKRRIEIRIE